MKREPSVTARSTLNSPPVNHWLNMRLPAGCSRCPLTDAIVSRGPLNVASLALNKPLRRASITCR